MMLVEEFRRRGAISPDRAMTTSELGLPPWFEKAMRGRLGRLGLFVEVYGKYYLNEERLRELRELYFDRSRHITRGRRSFIRTLLMLPLGLIISAVIYFALLTAGVKPFLGLFLIVFVTASLVVSIARILYRKS